MVTCNPGYMPGCGRPPSSRNVIVHSTPGTTGWFSSNEADAAGSLHVSYYNVHTSDLMYAHRAPAGAWPVTPVDTIGDTGFYTSLALDGSGGVHVSYQDGTNDDLRYACRDPTGEWELVTVDAAGQTGYDTSMAVDSLGRVHIAYVGVNTVQHAIRSAAGVWTTSTVLHGALFSNPSIQVDPWGGVHVAFTDGSGDLRHAYRCPP